MLSKSEVIFFLQDRTHITHFSSGVPSVLGCLFVFTVRLSAFLTIRACVDGPISLILDRDVIRIFSEYFSDMSQKIQRGTSGRTLKHQYLAQACKGAACGRPSTASASSGCCRRYGFRRRASTFSAPSYTRAGSISISDLSGQ